MTTFFYGWRRKIGVLTLVMACVLMAGWIRSLYVRDQITILRKPVGWVVSSNGEIYQSASFAVTRGRPAGGSGWYLWRVPYWSIVIPLTLFSAYLLISKRRIPKTKKPAATD